MSTRTVAILPTIVACANESLIDAFLTKAKADFPDDIAILVETTGKHLPVLVREEDRECPLLLIRLPERVAHELEALASAKFEISNEHNAGLIQCETYASLTGPEHRLSIGAWSMHKPWTLSSNPLLIALVAGEAFVLVRREVSLDDSEILEVALQVQTMYSGPNYKPMQSPKPETLKAEKTLTEEVDSKRIIVSIYWSHSTPNVE